MEKLKSFLKKESFYPTWIGIFINPFYFMRSGLVRSLTNQAHNLSGKLLDVGCGSKPYQKLFIHVEQYVGLDIDNKNSKTHAVADFFYDGNTFPFGDASFDSVLCSEVLEHVFNPDHFLSEIHRTLKPEGYLLLTVPFIWEEHEHPYDYARYSSFGLKSLLEKNGFSIYHHEKIGADASTLFQLINVYLYKVTWCWWKYPRFLFKVLILGFNNFLGVLARLALPKNKDLFLGQLVLAKIVK